MNSEQTPTRGKNVKSVGLNTLFRNCAQRLALASGSPGAFAAAASAIVIWAALGPVFRFSDTWQLVVNTATTVVTFLMVFLLQNTQNRDTKALHLKLDELLRGVAGARTSFVNLEALSDEELAALQHEFERLSKRLQRKRKEIVAP